MSLDPGYGDGERKEPGSSFDVAVMRRGASVVLVVLAACLFGGARCGEKYWWMNQGSDLRFSLTNIYLFRNYCLDSTVHDLLH